MGYTHYWRQSRPFTAPQWTRLCNAARYIIAKAQRGHYSGPETNLSQFQADIDSLGFRHNFAERGAWRTFPHEEIATAAQGEPIRLAGSCGTGEPEVSDKMIALNGSEAHGEDYESFVLERAPEENFAFCKTEYRPYDPVVVSILHAARTIAPKAIKVSSDGGEEVIRMMF